MKKTVSNYLSMYIINADLLPDLKCDLTWKLK